MPVTLLSLAMVEERSHNGNCTDHKAQNVVCLDLDRKNLLAPDLTSPDLSLHP
jgi:hypothetical protein